MKQKIFLNDTFSFDLATFMETRALFLANSGGGKSHLIRKIMEETHPYVQQILIDPEGEFATLREKFDYLLVGKNGDTPATIKSAALLARKLMELRISAIIDISELQPRDRKHYVRLFLESMIEAPKELWLTEHPALVILDEAHHFAPEKGESEALDAVIDLMSRGRKRGLCGALATQRISKLNKDAAAECNNKLIGRTSQDIDMKRAAEELGFTSKVDMLSLRNLQPGEFYAFGSAMCNVPEKIKIGNVKTTHPKVGSRSISRTTAPRGAIKAALSKLADLPEEAEKEAKTMAQLQAEVRTLKAHKCPVLSVPRPIDEKAIYDKYATAFATAENAYKNVIKNYYEHSVDLRVAMEHAANDLKEAVNKYKPPNQSSGVKIIVPKPKYPEVGSRISYEGRTVAVAASQLERAKKILNSDIASPSYVDRVVNSGNLTQGEKKVLIAIAQHEEGISRENITLMTGYKRSTRDKYIQYLSQKMLINTKGDTITATQSGIEELGNEFVPLPKGADLIAHYMTTLPEGEKKILGVLVRAMGQTVSREDISAETNFQRSTRDKYLQYLIARKLVENAGAGAVRAVAKLFE